MLEYISLMFLVFTSLIGIYSIAHCITTTFFTSVYNKNVINILPLKGEIENIDIIICNLLDDYGNIVLVDYGLNSVTKNKIIELTQTYKKLKLISKYEILEIVNSKSRNIYEKDFIK